MLLSNRQDRNPGRTNELLNEMRVLRLELPEESEARERRREEGGRMSPYSEPANTFSSRLRRNG